jgi:isopentenyl phosphate kinase
LPVVTPTILGQIRQGLGGSHGVDVTGGMAAKVEQVFSWLSHLPQLEILICSGLEAGNVEQALVRPERAQGTWLRRHGT